MFTYDAFGQRIKCKPSRLRFITDDEQKAADAAAADKAEKDRIAKEAAAKAEEETRGYPLNTAPADMTAVEQVAYWKAKSRENENKAKARDDYDDLKAKADAHDKWKAEHATDEEKAIEDARRNGENIGAQKYLKEAVKGRFQAITRKSDEDVETAFEHVDAMSFTDDKGEIDVEKLRAFAKTFGAPSDDDQGGNGGDSYSQTIRNSRKPLGKNNAGSIAAKRKQYVEDQQSKSNRRGKK